MANPQRVPDPRLDDPLTPPPLAGTGPLNERLTPNPDDTRIDNRTIVSERRSGSGVLIAVVVLVVAVIAYFLFAPGGQDTPVPADQPAATTEPAAPQPSATAPAATAPEATAPAMPAPNATAPAAPESTPTEPTPTEAAPTTTAPAAPAQ